MRNFIYKSIVVLICIVLVYEFTIGKQILYVQVMTPGFQEFTFDHVL